MSDDAGKILSYPTPPRRNPIPVWKHVVFVPLLLWIGAFIVAMAAGFLWIGGTFVYRLFIR